MPNKKHIKIPSSDWLIMSRGLSVLAKSAWIDLLCLLRESPTCGSRSHSIEEWALELGHQPSTTEAVFLELERKQLLKVKRECNAECNASVTQNVTENVTLYYPSCMREEMLRESTRYRVKKHRDLKCNAKCNDSENSEKNTENSEKKSNDINLTNIYNNITKSLSPELSLTPNPNLCLSPELSLTPNRVVYAQNENRVTLETEKKPMPETTPQPLPQKRPKKPKSEPIDFLTALRSNPAYRDLDIDRELAKMDAWLSLPANRKRRKTDRFVLNWLNKADRVMTPPTVAHPPRRFQGPGSETIEEIEEKNRKLEAERLANPVNFSGISKLSPKLRKLVECHMSGDLKRGDQSIGQDIKSSHIPTV